MPKRFTLSAFAVIMRIQQIGGVLIETASSWRKRRGGGEAVSHTPPIAPASMPSTSHQQQLLTRSVEKMFEEAELSGVLQLAGRKLKEFPSNLAVKYDISDVISTDLSDNRLSELPVCICELSSMETLRVRGTGLRSLPAAVQLLDSLTYLDLSGNQLTSLPAGLFSIRLQVLLLTGNRLESIPREIRQLAESLHELDASCNRLRGISADVALLKSLRVLNLRANRLTHLPSELSRLELRVLDVSENELTELPSDLRHMCSLVDLRTDANPLLNPPAKICSKGREHAFKWLRIKVNPLESQVRHLDWSLSRPSSINATMRRARHTNEHGSDNAVRRVERRSRSTRFNTLGGSDSGYASTADEHRYSHEFQTSTAVGCLFGIAESLRSPPAGQESPAPPDGTDSRSSGSVMNAHTSEANCSSGLLKEVMTAYAEKMGLDAPPLKETNGSSTHLHRTAIERALLYSSSSILSSSNPLPAACSSTVVSRPQAIVPPMNSKPVSSGDADYSVDTITTSDLIKKEALVETAIVNNTVSITKVFTAADVENAIDLSNNNTPKSMVVNTPSAASVVTNRGDSCCFNSPEKMSGCLSSTQSTKTALTSAQIESIYTGGKQCTLMENRLHDNEPIRVLSPVIEAPPTPASTLMQPSSASATVQPDDSISSTTCVAAQPKSAASSAVRSAAVAASVSSSIKAPSVHVPQPSSGSSRTSSANSSRSSLASSSRAPPLSKKAVSYSHGVTQAGPSRPAMLPARGSKLTKTRDSLGLTRNHLSSHPVRKSSATASAQSRPKNGESGSTPIAHTTVTTTVTHSSCGVIENMRKALEQRLNACLPNDREQLAASLADGVQLCNFANRIRVRAVPIVLTPVSQQAQLSSPKCRRNVENFLSACRRMGVPEMSLCSCSDIMERKNLQHIARTVVALNKLASNTTASSRISENRRLATVSQHAASRLTGTSV